MKLHSIKILLLLLMFSVVHKACSADTKTNAYVKAWILSCNKAIKQDNDKTILKDHIANLLDAFESALEIIRSEYNQAKEGKEFDDILKVLSSIQRFEKKLPEDKLYLAPLVLNFFKEICFKQLPIMQMQCTEDFIESFEQIDTRVTDMLTTARNTLLAL